MGVSIFLQLQGTRVCYESNLYYMIRSLNIACLSDVSFCRRTSMPVACPLSAREQGLPDVQHNPPALPQATRLVKRREGCLRGRKHHTEHGAARRQRR